MNVIYLQICCSACGLEVLEFSRMVGCVLSGSCSDEDLRNEEL
jgi:hypothetical protein